MNRAAPGHCTTLRENVQFILTFKTLQTDLHSRDAALQERLDKRNALLGSF